MASLYITEYARATIDALTNLPTPEEPPVATQKVTYTGTAAASAAFNAETRFISYHSDGICSVAFGTDPTATVAFPRKAASVDYFAGVKPGMKISAIVNT